MHRSTLVALAAFAAAPVLAADPPPVPWPEGYRQWTHVKSLQLLPGHPLYESFGGIHHIYANKAAMTGYRTGRFPDGAVIVFDLFEADSAGNAVGDGARKIVGVMHRDRARYPKTAGWGFEGFKPATRERAVGANAEQACFQCHLGQKDRDYVFSAFRP